MHAFSDSYLAPASHYGLRSASERTEARARYSNLEAELSANQPLGRTLLLGAVGMTHVLGLPEGLYVLEQRTRVIVAPPWIWRARIGLGLFVGASRVAFLAPTAELVGLPGRDAYVLRAGLIVRARLWPQLEVRVNFVPPLWSPDAIGIRGGDFGQLGVRYRWSHALR